VSLPAKSGPRRRTAIGHGRSLAAKPGNPAARYPAVILIVVLRWMVPQVPYAGELAADVGAGQADRPVAAVAGGGEPAAEAHVLVGLQAVGEQGGARVVIGGLVTILRPGIQKVDHWLGDGRGADRDGMMLVCDSPAGQLC
jgi:hypothetical protein